MPKFLEKKLFITSSCLLFIVVWTISCAPKRQVIDSQLEIGRFGYLQDGKTNRQEIIDRLGHPTHRFENGRIVIYPWVETEIYDIVLIFGENNVLERHSVVRVR